MKISHLEVFNTSAKRGGMDRVRVLRDGQVIGEVYMRRRNPLAYLRGHRDSTPALALCEQLRGAGVDVPTIERILARPAKPGIGQRLVAAAMAWRACDPLSAAWFGVRTC
jgi:hypothetical protein